MNFDISWILEWFRQLPIQAQATIIVAILSGIVSFFGILVKRIFDSLSERSAARREIFHTMLEKLHPLYMSSYSKHAWLLSDLSDSVKYYLELKAEKHTHNQVVNQAKIAFYYYSRCLKSSASDEPLILANYEAEIAQDTLAGLFHPYVLDSKKGPLPVFGATSASIIQKLMKTDPSYVDFERLCRNRKMAGLFKRFLGWLEASDQEYLQNYVLWMRAFSNLIHYHCDMLYTSWYRARPPWMDAESVSCIRTMVPGYRCGLSRLSFAWLWVKLRINWTRNRSCEQLLRDLVR